MLLRVPLVWADATFTFLSSSLLAGSSPCYSCGMLRSPGVRSPPGPHTWFHLVPRGVHHPTLYTLCLPAAPPWLLLAPLLCLSCHRQSPPPPHSPPHHALLRPQVRSQELPNFITKEDELLEDGLCPLGVCLAHTVDTD